jgi:hypothetical protein
MDIVKMAIGILAAAGCEVTAVTQITLIPKGSKRLIVRMPNVDFNGTVEVPLNFAEQRFDVAFIDNHLGRHNGHVLVPLMLNTFMVGISAEPIDRDALFRAEPGVQVALLRPSDLRSALTGDLPVAGYEWRDDFDVATQGHIVLETVYKQLGARK